MAIIIASPKLQRSWKTLLIYILGTSLSFWLWTNFGVWLFGNLYPKTPHGFYSCYIAALPFLRNSLLGDMIWGLAIFGSFDWVTTKILRSIPS